MKGHWISYSPDELAWIEARKQLTRADLHAQFQAQWGRPEVTFETLRAMCKRRGWLTGRTGHFTLGGTTENGGFKVWDHPNSVATRRKKGDAPPNRVPLGTERVTCDGYVEISVAELNPYTKHPRRFVQKHRWLWEQAHGPVPNGHRLKCLDGDKTNTDPSNWEPLPYAMAPRLNGKRGRGYDAAPAELKPTIMAIAKLEHRAREMRKGKDHG